MSFDPSDPLASKLPRPQQGSVLETINEELARAADQDAKNERASAPGRAAEPSQVSSFGSRAGSGRAAPKDQDQVAPPRSTKRIRGERDPAAVRGGLRVVLTLTLALATVSAGLPAVLIAWVTAAHAAMAATAAVLERTGGLGESFSTAYWLALTAHGAVVLWGIVRALKRTSAPWRPLLVAVVLESVLLWTLLPMQVLAIADIPALLLAVLAMGADWLVRYALPVVLLVAVIRGLAYAWAAAQESGQAARSTAAMAFCLSAVGVTLMAYLFLLGAGARVGVLVPHLDKASELIPRGPASQRETYTALSTLLLPKTPAPAPASIPAEGQAGAAAAPAGSTGEAPAAGSGASAPGASTPAGAAPATTYEPRMTDAPGTPAAPGTSPAAGTPATPPAPAPAPATTDAPRQP